jgi:hypothetical protein
MATPTNTPTALTRPAPTFQPRRIQRLSDPENAQFLADMKERIRNEPDFARRMLQGAGILDAEGKLTQPYRD